MTANRLLTFELTANARALEIYCDGEGLKDLIHYVRRLSSPKNPSIPNHDHWMAESIGGYDLTDQRQAHDTMLCVMVTARYSPPRYGPIVAGAGAESAQSHPMPEPALLTFEASPPTDSLTIFGNQEGLRSFAERLRRIAEGNSTQAVNVRWTTGDGLLSNEKQSDATTLIKEVVVRYKPIVASM